MFFFSISDNYLRKMFIVIHWFNFYLTLWMPSPFHGSVPKDFFQICLPWRIRVKRHSTWPNVKLHTRFLTLWVVNCNVKLHTRV
jgi:hypothetical protein